MNKWLLLFVMIPALSQAQSVGIGTETPNASAMLDVSGTTKGLLIPRLTEAQKEAIATPATGLLIWQTDNTSGFYYNGGTPEGPKWYMLSVAADTDWKLAGNNNVDSATHFLGSINKAPVYFKVRNTWAGQLDSGKATFFGYKAGWKAPHKFNTAFGTEALSAPSEEEGNSAFGFWALKENRTGDWLTAIGGYALNSNISGKNNTALGFQTLYTNISGNGNTAVGGNALFFNATGSQNTAVGNMALQNNISERNTAVGHSALGGTYSGYHNTAIGRAAGTMNTTGINNTFVGYESNVNTNSNTNATAIGYKAYAACNNCLILGSIAGQIGAESSVNVGIGTTNPGFRLQVGMQGDGSVARANSWTTFSDERYKSDIIKIDGALDKIDHINGYYYTWKTGEDKTRQAGLLAQEVEKVLPEIVSTDSDGYKSVDYGKMNALLLQAVKELSERIQILESAIAEQNK